VVNFFNKIELESITGRECEFFLWAARRLDRSSYPRGDMVHAYCINAIYFVIYYYISYEPMMRLMHACAHDTRMTEPNNIRSEMAILVPTSP
jgi:hypothetical protein